MPKPKISRHSDHIFVGEWTTGVDKQMNDAVCALPRGVCRTLALRCCVSDSRRSLPSPPFFLRMYLALANSDCGTIRQLADADNFGG
ncbi:MAG: hypothetical protein ACKESB_02725 [Candidatus Hodgkinia cicadicola]